MNSALRRGWQAEDTVKRPVEGEGVDHEEDQQTGFHHGGLPQRDIEPPGHQRNQHGGDTAFKAHGVHDAAQDGAAFDALARFPLFKQVVEAQIPADRNRRRGYGHDAGITCVLADGHEDQAGNHNRNGFVQRNIEDAALGALQAGGLDGGGTDYRCGRRGSGCHRRGLLRHGRQCMFQKLKIKVISYQFL